VKSGRLFRITLIALSILTIEARATVPIERSVSPSGQFVIYGGDAHWRGAMSKLAEQIKSNLVGVLQRRDQWTTAVVINLQSRAANIPEIPNVALRFSQTGSGLKLQLDLSISPEMNASAVERELLRVILLEMIYRNQTGIASGETYVEPPDWLIDGLLALAPNRDRASLVNALKVSERVPSLAELVRERPELLDPITRSLYRAYSFALVQLLAESPARLGRYIDSLAFASNDLLADLQKSFPQLAGGDSEKIWKSKVAGVTNSTRSELLTYWQTEEKLAALLETRFPAATGRDKSLSLEDLCQKNLSLTQKLALKKFGEDLVLLAARANPALRPIVEDYQTVAAQLGLGKNHAVAARIGDLKTLRTKLSARMREVDDYMNWFEATQLRTQSGLFEDVERSPDTAEARPRRSDRFSVYLDAMEQQF